MSKPYFERQSGGSCRIHALNMLLGGPELDMDKMLAHAKKFGEAEGMDVSAMTEHKDMDLGYVSTTQNLVAHIAEARTGLHAFCVTPGMSLATILATMKCGASIDDFLDQGLESGKHGFRAFLQYNAGHIWAWRYFEGAWWQLDSMKRARNRGTGLSLSGLGADNGFIFLFTTPQVRRCILPYFACRIDSYLEAHEVPGPGEAERSVCEAAFGRFAMKREVHAGLLGELEILLFPFLHLFKRVRSDGEHECQDLLLEAAERLRNTRAFLDISRSAYKMTVFIFPVLHAVRGMRLA